MNRNLLVTLLVILFASTQTAIKLYAQTDKSTANAPGAKLAENMVNRLAKAKLTDDQIAEIQRLATIYGPKAWQIRKDVNITAEQREAMSGARKEGADAGKSGADLTKYVYATANLNDEQIKAMKEAGKVYREFQQMAFALLTTRQGKRAGITTMSKTEKTEKKMPRVLPATRILPSSQS